LLPEKSEEKTFYLLVESNYVEGTEYSFVLRSYDSTISLVKGTFEYGVVKPEKS
jgi:hypothetical protein